MNARFHPDPSAPMAFLGACPIHCETPLLDVPLPGGGRLWVKDEGRRLGLGSFKALGGVYTVGRLILEAWTAKTGEHVSPQDLGREDVRALAGQMTFITASDGNHGMAVATGAILFGAHARIHLSSTVEEDFVTRIRAKGAEAVRSGENYEESVANAGKDADDNGGIHVADGSWDGYTYEPSLIMEGYTVIAEELRGAFEARGIWPTHVFLQAGVGGIAAANAVMIRRNWAKQPEIIIVEPDAADCLLQSHAAGGVTQVEGPVSNMGRLDCKLPSMLAFYALEESNVVYVSVSDVEAQTAANTMKSLGLNTTPTGAAGFAALSGGYGFERENGAPFRPLIIMSEGPTDGSG